MSFTLQVREEKRRLAVSRGKLEKIARSTFALTKAEEGDISLVICNDPFITKLNERYTKRTGPTDVLAFPMREGEILVNQDAAVGDIVISVDTAERQAAELGTGLEQELILLFVHGLLHLLGYDHRNGVQKQEMDAITKKIVTGV
ncbi:MAG: rRNA maturation RNase YbeY [Spirochaetes bacterium]|nr:rRNA maturation RNase YbeY [Spirochaetota bacterium]